MEADKINELPGHIVDMILLRLPLKDAVRTSILSREWRYKWASLSTLIFDHSVLKPNKGKPNGHDELARIVDHILLRHNGPINKFKLSHQYLHGTADIDRWIQCLSRRPIQEFVLNFFKCPRYTLPYHMYLCGKLIHFEVYNCVVKPPPDFSGFKSLKSLMLSHVITDQSFLDKLLSGCMLLERLTLEDFDGVCRLNIRAPNLKFLEVFGYFSDINLENTSQLSYVSIGLYDFVDNARGHNSAVARNLIKFFSSLPHIQRLELKCLFLKFLTDGVVPKRLPSLCRELTHLTIHVNLNYVEEYLAALCIMRSSPNLQKLQLWTYPHQQKEHAAKIVRNDDEEDQRSCSFNQLRFVNIRYISGHVAEINFIDIVLANSPVLRMAIQPAHSDTKEKVKECVQNWQACTKAEVIYVDPQSRWKI